MATGKVCILGGTGFVGHAIAARLSASDYDTRVLTRAFARHRDLTVLPGCVLIEGNVHDPAFLQQQFKGVDVVINLVGILNERGHSGAGFEHAHVDLPAKITTVCRHVGVPRLLHMSALGAAPKAPSFYLRTKARGEDAAHGAAPDVRVTSFRPSVIFGPRDDFTNRFARLLRLVPGVFPLACPDAKFQPVYVENVARAFVDAIGKTSSYGQRYDLCGPTVYRLRDLVSYLAALQNRHVRVIGLNATLSRLQATLLEYVPGKPFSLDNYRSLSLDSVCTGANTLRAVFGIEPTPLEQIAPAYLTAL
ncbi:MAG: epimerase [Candidatus Muproteobacteria bacterium RBG_16_60_9]|uniref:Epimerase n=1 Tax=Candidatus Muproteobacteria bacterium RBG_16_60_9 TaxID=1817755 RepID=A0A1F6UZ76_9PROT|nr:MAG: epimerase [Candidatus Muproteobacteria bacterium RBG_16_60_9]